MKLLRRIHLYLGCLFAPLIIYFCLSGIWQTVEIKSSALAYLSTMHHGGQMKSGETLSSPLLEWIIVAMALSLIFTVLLGVVMALRFGKKKTALGCILAGIGIPMAVVLHAQMDISQTHTPPHSVGPTEVTPQDGSIHTEKDNE